MECKGLSYGCTKHSTLFIKENPQYKDKELFFDNLYKDNFAKLNKGSDGFCVFLDRNSRLCSIYQNRPKVCKDFSNKSKHCERICIKSK